LASYLILLALKKDLNKVETYPNPCKDERHAEPDFSGDSQLPLCLQVVAERNTEEDNRYGYKDDSQG
jgi:type II secretory pathway component PulJ